MGHDDRDDRDNRDDSDDSDDLAQPMSDRLTVFVYFKVPTATPQQAVRAAIARLAAIRIRDGHRFTVMRRHRERTAGADTADSVTWMEVHEAVPRGALDAWLEALADAAREAGIDVLAPGGRHVEVFEAISP
jgi:hypothetical protein